MIVKTHLRNSGKEIVFSGGLVVKFNSQCEAELPDDVANKLMAAHPKLVFKDFPEVEKPKLMADEFNEKRILQLEGDLIELKSQLASKDRMLEEAKNEANIWKNKTEELNSALKLKTTENEIMKENEAKLQSKYDLHVSLLSSGVTSLQKTCEKSGLPREEWEKLSKEKLIEYMLKKS